MKMCVGSIFIDCTLRPLFATHFRSIISCPLDTICIEADTL